MTLEGALTRTFISFAVLLGGAVLGWMFPFGPVIGFSALIAFVLAMVSVFRKEPSVGLTLAYAVFEGIAVGGISRGYQDFIGDGIVTQAVWGTLGVVGAVLLLFRSGKVHTSARGNRIWRVLFVGYISYTLVNIILVALGTVNSPFGLDSSVSVFGVPLGIVVGLVVVGLACYSLVGDFEYVQQGIENKVDAKYEWTAAFGIMVTVVWLYLHILRILALARRS